MKILGISLGHDTNFALIEDGQVTAMMEAERFFRQKRYKLECGTLEHVTRLSTFQYVNTAELERFLEEQVATHWGKSFDAIAVQNQGRLKEYENLKVILQRHGFTWARIEQLDHHLSHASLAFYTSPFREAVVFSYDGSGNDGHTIVFKADGTTGLEYVKADKTEFGKSYNNLGYLLGIRPEICGTSSGKTMGLCSYGAVRTEWLPAARKYVRSYKKLSQFPVEGIRDHGKGHRSNSQALRNIPELRKYLVKIPREAGNPVIDFLRQIFDKHYRYELSLPGPVSKDAQDLAQTVQHAWTEEVLSFIKDYRSISPNICVVGGCALNGITNYDLQEARLFKSTHFVPNPSDCGLSAGAALNIFWKLSGQSFRGYGEYFSPYLGLEPFDMDKLPELRKQYPSYAVAEEELPKNLAAVLAKDRIVGVIRGRYEIGPRALGNRSILCSPLNPNMRDILNEKVKRREWYRPFAPVVPAEDASKYFTNQEDIPYMSVICSTRPEWQEKLPSVTHVDGTARVQTVRHPHNPFLYNTLKAFEDVTGASVLLNTSFNPGGEPILNYCSVGLEMLKTTELDMVLIGNEFFVKPGNEHLLDALVTTENLHTLDTKASF